MGDRMTQDATHCGFSIVDCRLKIQNPKFKIQHHLAIVVLLGLMGTGGCEKLGGSTPTPTATKTTQSSPAFPSRPSVSPDQVVATVNGTTISVKDVEIAVADLKATTEALGRKWEPLSPERNEDAYDLHDLLDELILAELRTQDAISRGLDRRTEVQALFWYRYRNFFSQEWVTWQLEQAKLEVKEEEVEEYFKSNPWVFREPETVRVRELVAPSEEQAKAALVQIYSGADFVTVANQVSSRRELASGEAVDKQWIMRGAEKATFAANNDAIRALDPVLEQAVFAIDKIGGVSSYVKSAENTFHVFQLVERTEGRQKPLTEVADAIRNFLRLQKMTRKNDALKTQAKVETFLDRLSSVEQP